MSRFAAYKALHVQTVVNRALNDAQTPEADRSTLAKRALRIFERYQDAERSTAVARARTAKQFEQFMQPDNLRLFPNLKWLPSRSADPRLSHTAFYNHIWAKDDPFWNTNCPGTEWNCKCDIEQTDEPVTDNTSVPSPAVPLGLEGNPANTGEVFTDNASYIRTLNRRDSDIGKKVVKLHRDNLREKYETTSTNIDTDLGRILIDNISVQEMTKGAKTEKSYFYKQEIAQNIGHYTSQMVLVNGHETIDLTHNNHRSIYYQRKKLFTHMEVYRLDTNGYSYCIKLGVFANGEKNLYCITEPDW